MFKYFDKVQKEVLGKYQKDLVRDFILNRPDKLVFYSEINSNDPELHLVVGNLKDIGFEDRENILLSDLLKVIDLNNGYAEVGGKQEYYDMIVSKALDFSTPTTITFPIIAPGGRLWIRFTSYLVDEEDNIQTFEFTNISQFMGAEEAIYFKTHHDSLTGLFNKYTLDYHYGLRYKYDNFHVLYLDIDDFKHLNDTLGHRVGNSFLQNFTKILKKYEKNYSRFYRVGGDEFIGLFFDIEENIKKIADNIIKSTRKILLPNAYFNVTVSIGIVQANIRDDVIRKADTVMYKAKKLGKNRFLYEVETSVSVNDR